MQPPIRPQLSNINISIWYFTLTVMHHTYQSHGHVAALDFTIAWDHYQPTRNKLQTSHHQQMAQSTLNVESSNMWWRPQPKQDLGEYSKMGKQLYPSASNSMNSVLPNHQPQSKQTAPWPKVFSPLQLYKKFPRQWTCNFIGWRKEWNKNTFCLLETRKPKHGGLIHKTSPTTSP